MSSFLQNGLRCSLSPGERVRVRGKGASTVKGVTALSKAGWRARIDKLEAIEILDVSFPLTPPLSLGERENQSLRLSLI